MKALDRSSRTAIAVWTSEGTFMHLAHPIAAIDIQRLGDDIIGV